MTTNKVLIFDLDGILVETSFLQKASFDAAFQLFGYNPDYDEHHARPTAWSMEQIGVEPRLREYLAATRKGLILKMAPNYIQPEETHRKALLDLKALGYRLAVCTNAEVRVAKYFLELAGLQFAFDFVQCRDGHYLSAFDLVRGKDQYRTKPDPEMLYEICRYFSGAGDWVTGGKYSHVSTQDCILIGDSDTDEGAAKKADMPFVRSDYHRWIQDIKPYL